VVQCSYSVDVLDGHTIDKVGTITYATLTENKS